MARPKKEIGNLRTLKIEVRASPDEKKQIAANAKKAGFTTSDYLRGYGLDENVKFGSGNLKAVRQIPNIDQEGFIRLKGEIGKVGSNVNQIARALNMRREHGEHFEIPDEVIVKVMLSVDTVIEHLLEILGYGH